MKSLVSLIHTITSNSDQLLKAHNETKSQLQQQQEEIILNQKKSEEVNCY